MSDYLIINTATSSQTRAVRYANVHNRGKRVVHVLGRRVDPARPMLLTKEEVDRDMENLKRLEKEGLIRCKLAGTQQDVTLLEGVGAQVVPGSFEIPGLLREPKKGDWGPTPFHNIPTPEGGFDWQPPVGWTARSRDMEEAADAARREETLLRQEPPLPPTVLPDLPTEDLGPPALRGTPAPEAAAALKQANPDFFEEEGDG
jgi:hypothetical protein